MTLIHGILIFTSLCTCASIIAIMHVLKSFEKTLDIISKFVIELGGQVIKLKFSSRRDNDSGVQGMAEDTEMEQ